METMANRVAEMAWHGMHTLEAIEELGGKAVRRDCGSATTYYSMPDGSELWVADCGDWDIVSENEIGEGGEELGRLATYWDQTASQKAAQAAWHVE